MREIYCDTASLSSLNLLKVLLAERGLKPALRPLPDYDAAPSLENVF
jgi:predicted solute-binding protein